MGSGGDESEYWDFRCGHVGTCRVCALRLLFWFRKSTESPISSPTIHHSESQLTPTQPMLMRPLCFGSSATLPQLLRSHIYSLRALLPFPQHSLVPRQTAPDRLKVSMVQRPCPPGHFLQLPSRLGHLPVHPCLPRRMGRVTPSCRLFGRATRPADLRQRHWCRRTVSLCSQRRRSLSRRGRLRGRPE